MKVTPIIEVSNLSFKYDVRQEQETLSQLNFFVKSGEWLAVIGDNGSGKSTLAQVLVGLLDTQKGEIRIAGISMNEESKWEIRKHIGIVFQNPDNQFVGSSVQDDVAFALENMNLPYLQMKQRVDDALKLVGIYALRLHDPSRLSGGQKQRVALAGILALKPSVIILDEALVMLDPTSRKELLETLKVLKKEGITIISITHDMNEASCADRIMLLEKGTIKQISQPSIIFQDQKHLDVPFAEKLRRELVKRGGKVPNTYMTEKEMVSWLCK